MDHHEKRWKLAFNAPATLLFALICLVAFGLDLLSKGRTNHLLFTVYRSSALDPLTYLRLFGHVCGHANLSHLTNNLMYILILGPMLEEKYGTSNMVFVMLATALATGLMQTIFFPTTGLLGASGIVFAMILLSSITSMKSRTVPITFCLVAALYIGREVYDAFFTQDNVSNMAHIVGGVVGAGLGFLMNRWRMNRY